MALPSQVADVRWNLNPPPAVGPHAYFDQWAASPQCVHAYSLRDDAQLETLAHKNTFYPHAAPGWTYDAGQDAGRGLLYLVDPIDADILPQLWITDPTTSGTLTFVWDMLLPSMWSQEPGNAGGDSSALPSKAFQTTITSGTSLGIFMETRTHLKVGLLPDIAHIDWRSYSGVLGPGVSRSKGATGFNSDTIQPLLVKYLAHADVWTRFVEHVQLNALTDGGVVYDLWSLWVMDEQRDAVQLYNGIAIGHPVAGVKGFAFEWDNSQQRPVGSTPISIYNRNFLMFRGLLEPELLLTKPIA